MVGAKPVHETLQFSNTRRCEASSAAIDVTCTDRSSTLATATLPHIRIDRMGPSSVHCQLPSTLCPGRCATSALAASTLLYQKTHARSALTSLYARGALEAKDQRTSVSVLTTATLALAGSSAETAKTSSSCPRRSSKALREDVLSVIQIRYAITDAVVVKLSVAEQGWRHRKGLARECEFFQSLSGVV